MADGTTTRGIDTVGKYLKGINTDVHPVDQSPGTYRFALNMMLESREGDYTSIVNEEGNMLCDFLEENYVVMGTVFADKNQVIIFSTNPVTGLSDIGILDQWCNYTTLIRSSCLSFDLKYPIQGVFRLRNGCERVVYFTDDLNPLRSINIDSLQQYTIGNVDPSVANSTDAWDCGKFKNNLDYEIASFTSARINDGGGLLKAGAYFFGIRYLDVDKNPTNWFYISQPVNVGSGTVQDEYNYDGGVLDLVSVDTFNEGKSITLTLDDLDTSFSYVQLGVIKLTRATGFEPEVVLVTEREISNTSIEYTYTGDPVSETSYTLTELTVPKVVFNRVKTLAQIDSRLVLANINDNIRDWSVFQRNTSQSYLLWKTESNPIQTINLDGSTRSQKGGYYSLTQHGYMRDEIYAFGLVYVFNDGTESPVFHIPGRPKNFAKGTDTAGFFQDMSNSDLVTQGNSNTHNRNQVPIGENWDTQILDVVTAGTVIDPETEVDERNVQHIPVEEFVGGSCGSVVCGTYNAVVNIGFIADPGGDILVINIPDGVLISNLTLTSGAGTCVSFTSPIGPTAGTVWEIDTVCSLSGLDVDLSFDAVVDDNGCRYFFHFEEISFIMPTLEYPAEELTFNYNDLETSSTGCQIERWKVWNTAVGTITPDASGEIRMGVMGYYEADELYPDVNDCDGVSVWGDDVEGNPLEGEKVRHHRMPDTVLCNIRSNIGDVYPDDTRTGGIDDLYVMVCNVNYPVEYASEIQGYYLVRVDRDNTNKTVIDKGLFGVTFTDFDRSPNPANSFQPSLGDWVPSFELSNPTTFPSGTIEDFSTQLLGFYSPVTLFDRDTGVYNGYYKTERIVSTDLTTQVYSGIETDTIQIVSANSYNSLPDTDDAFRDTTGYVFVDGGTYQTPFNNIPVSIGNIDFATDIHFTHLESALSNQGEALVYYASLKQWLKPYGDLSNLSYIRTHNSLLTDNGTNSFEDVFTGGDCYITELTWKSSVHDINSDTGGDPNLLAGPNLKIDFFVESEINVDLRMTGEERYETHVYKCGAPNQNGIGFFTSDLNTLAEANYTESGQFEGEYGKNFFQANFDTFAPQNFNRYFPLPNTFDYCSDCQEDFPNRIWYSERAYQESTDDKYKIFLANNYRDLYGEDSEVFKLFVYNDELYALTPYTTWFIPTRPQQLTTNEGNIFVGTGDVLSIPPKRLQTSDIGYAGSFHPHSVTSSENGVVFVDSNAGKIFLLRGQQLQEISAMGMRNWFRENLPLNITQQIQEFENFSTAHKFGAGFISCYDPRHNRVIIVKKDYRLLIDLEDLLVTEDYQDTTGYTYGYNYTTGWFYTKDGEEDEVLVEPTEDENEDLSWCISFTFNNNCWDSFHSYRPTWLWNNRTDFFSTLGRVDGETENIWKHGERNYGEFYDEVCPSVIDATFNNSPVNTKVTNSFQIISYAQDFVNDHFVDVPHEVYSKAIIYNSDQSSGLLDIVVKNTQTNPFVEIDNVFDQIYINNNERVWSFSEFYDMTTDVTEPIFTHDWSNTDYRLNRSGYGFIDYPNAARVDFAKSQFEMETFRDSWVGVRLQYDNTPVYKFVTQFGKTKNNISFK